MNVRNDVQLEYGHVRIANRLYEAMLDADFTGAQMRIVLVLFRLTYGWRRKTVTISIPELAALTRQAPVGGFRRALQDLIAAGVVLRIDGGVGAVRSTYHIQKDFTQWGRYSIAPTRLESVWGKRPDSADDRLTTAESGGETLQGSTKETDPTGSDLKGKTLQGSINGPSGVLPTAVNANADTDLAGRKDMKDIAVCLSVDSARAANPESRLPIAPQLIVAANRGMFDNPLIGERMTSPISSGHAPSLEAAEKILAAGVDPQWAISAIYTAAKNYRPTTASRWVRSLGYFVGQVLDGWAAESARITALAGSPPQEIKTPATTGIRPLGNRVEQAGDVARAAHRALREQQERRRAATGEPS